MDANDPPVVLEPLSDQLVLQDQPFIYELNSETFYDPEEDDVLTYSATLSNGEPLPSWLTFDATELKFSGTPGNSAVGVLTIAVKATDLAGASVTATFVLTVQNVNDPPVVQHELSDQVVEQDQLFTYELGSETFSDPDVDDVLTYSASLEDGGALPDWLSFDS